MTDLSLLLITVITANGAITEQRDLVPRDQCQAIARRIIQDSAFRIEHDAAMRGWAVRVSPCREAILPAAAEGLGH